MTYRDKSRDLDMAQKRTFASTLRADVDTQIKRLLAAGCSLAETARVMRCSISRVRRVDRDGGLYRAPAKSVRCPSCEGSPCLFECETCVGTGKVLIK